MGGCGCSGGSQTGQSMVDKLRMKGFSTHPMPAAVKIICSCEEAFMMETLESRCPKCGMVYGVTPCSASDANNIEAAGVDY